MSEARPSPSGLVVGVRQAHAARRRARRIAVAALAVAVVAGLVWLVWGSSVLTVRQIEVNGATLVGSDAVVAAGAVTVGQPLVRVDTGRVAERVSALPEVASVSVHRVWPHTLRLDVTERQAVLQREAADAAGAAYQWVDAGGTVFHTDATRLDVPLVRTPGEDPALLRDVGIVAARVPADLAAHVVVIEATSLDRISLALDDGRQVIWGSAEESDLKAQVITALLAQPGTVYDVSAPGHPAVR